MITAAVIGCGPRGREHARAFVSIEGIQLVGAADVDAQRRAQAAGELHVPVFAAADALLTQAQPNVVVLATGPAARMPIVEQIVRFKSVRALVVEKPMAASLAEANRLVDLCEAAGIRLVIGHQLRFCPEFTALKRAVDAGEIGRLESLQGFCFGNLLDQGTHLLDMICWLAGAARAQWVMSQSCGDREILARQAAGRPARWSDPAHPAPAWMVHQIGFENGLRATLETGPLHQRSGVFIDDWLQKRITAIGSQGMAEAQTAGFFKILTNGSSWKQVDGSLAGYQAATAALHEELRDVLATGGSHRNDWHDTLRSFKLLAACAQSAVDGSLTTLPIDPERDTLAELGAMRRFESAKGMDRAACPVLRSERSHAPDRAGGAPHAATRSTRSGDTASSGSPTASL
jgi:predicted dehydrogenase